MLGMLNIYDSYILYQRYEVMNARYSKTCIFTISLGVFASGVHMLHLERLQRLAAVSSNWNLLFKGFAILEFISCNLGIE